MTYNKGRRFDAREERGKMTEREASTQVHDLNDPDMAGDVLTMDEVVAEFGYDWGPPNFWPLDESPTDEEIQEWGRKMGVMD